MFYSLFNAYLTLIDNATYGFTSFNRIIFIWTSFSWLRVRYVWIHFFIYYLFNFNILHIQDIKLINYELKKVQITCPNCKYEFPYNKNMLEKKINQLGNDIQKITKKINYIKKAIPKEEINVKELNKLEEEKENMIHILTDYKLRRKTLKQSEDRLVLNNLKIALRELGGEELYKLCMDRALRESQSYNTNEIMSRRNYTHSGGGSLW